MKLAQAETLRRHSALAEGCQCHSTVEARKHRPWGPCPQGAWALGSRTHRHLCVAELSCEEEVQHGWLVSGTCLVGLLGRWSWPPHNRCAAGWALVLPGSGVWCPQALAALWAPSCTCAGERTPAGGIADSPRRASLSPSPESLLTDLLGF